MWSCWVLFHVMSCQKADIGLCQRHKLGGKILWELSTWRHQDDSQKCSSFLRGGKMLRSNGHFGCKQTKEQYRIQRSQHNLHQAWPGIRNGLSQVAYISQAWQLAWHRYRSLACTKAAPEVTQKPESNFRLCYLVYEHLKTRFADYNLIHWKTISKANPKILPLYKRRQYKTNNILLLFHLAQPTFFSDNKLSTT